MKTIGDIVTIERLKKASSIEPFTWKDKEFYCKVVSVYDGDTATIAFYYNKELASYKLRLYGIDTPELRSSDPQEKDAANRSKEYLSGMILDKICYVKLKGSDKYGRLLGIIYDLDKKVNYCDKMVLDKYAIIYDGKKRATFSEYITRIVDSSISG